MNLKTTFLKKTLALGFTAAMLHTAANAATYTAIANGNFSSTLTWAGGTVPPLSLSGSDEIIIPLGFKLTLDQNQAITAGTKLSVWGSLEGAANNYLVITGGTLDGDGTITVDSLYTNITSGFDFDGTLNVDKMATASSTLDGTAMVNIDQMLTVSGGVMTLNSSTLTMNTNSVIVFDNGGGISAGASSLGLTNKYHVIYRNGNYTGGVELSGTGLSNLEVSTGSSNSLMLGADLMLNGTLMLTSGTMNLNNHNLTLATGADFASAGAGTIATSSNSDITINTQNGLSGALRFNGSSNTVDDLTINLGNSMMSAGIGNDLQVGGQLSLQSGRLDVGSHKLTLASAATVTGGSTNSYVVTGNGGRMVMDLTANTSKTFHIGTSTGYAPMVLTGGSTSSASTFSLGVNANVMEMGTSGSDISATQPVVDATWFVESSATTNVKVDMEAMWAASMEANFFDRTKAYISHYTNAMWDMNATAAASMNANGMYSIKRTGISSFSPFAVFDENTAVSVNNIAKADAQLSVYPNPAQNSLNINYTGAAQANTVEIYNVAGQLVKTADLQNTQTTVDVSSLTQGVYYLQLKGEGVSATQKFVKQ